jgi:NAD(P)-dependent dehydrogenase (short-subunit alcohol dehydrogenase family)
MELGLGGKRALVTGASRGIGFGCERALAAEGCDLAMAALDVRRLKAAVKAIRTEFRVGVTSHATDLSVTARQEALIDVVGDVDILVNNAGAIPPGGLADLDDEEWRQAWELKVFGYINLCRLLLPRMEARGSGVIVNVIGAAAVRPRPDYLAGAAGNSALVGFTRALGQRSIHNGVRVVAVNPGPIMTDRLEEMLRAAAQERFGNPERWDDLIPTDPGPGTIEQVADVVAFLASDRASHVNATAITVDGGATGA